VNRFLLSLLLWLLIPAGLFGKQIAIAVVAIHGEEKAMQAWTPTVEFLQRTLPQHTFKLIPFTPDKVEQLKESIASGTIDFVISQPAIYVELELSNGISRILTMIDKSRSAEFGSVMITRSDSGIKRLEQAKERRIAAVAPLGFGGWLIGYYEFLEHGIDLLKDASQVAFLGTQDKVLQAVMNRRADIGIIRTGFLENMARYNDLNLSKITVLNRQDDPDFPYLLSSRLYPEWAFAKTKEVSNALAKETAMAMMSIPPNSEAAKKAGFWEWTMPYNYQPVHELMQKLQVGPYKTFGEVTLWEFISQHKALTIISALFLLGMIVFMVISFKMRLKLQNYIDIIDRITIASQVDTKGKILHASQAFCNLTGYSKEELIGRKHTMLRHPDVPRAFYRQMRATLNAGKVWKGEIMNRRKDGQTIWSEATISPVYNAKRQLTGYTTVRQDITDKKKIEKQRLLFLQQSRLAQMGELIGMIAHQWRQPLNIIGLSTTKIQMESMLGMLDDAKLEKIMQNINTQVQYMSQTIDDFREFFQQDKELQKMNLRALLQESVDLLRDLFRSKKITITNDVDETLAVDVFPNEFKQVILNILNNAKDALLEHPEERRKILITAGQKDGKTTVFISDHGGGIDPKIIDKIFDPYFTTKFGSQGTGLGLYISKLIIEEHMHGTIAAVNNPEGACIVIKLPEEASQKLSDAAPVI
jgi:PAS domain S-box-containing protein